MVGCWQSRNDLRARQDQLLREHFEQVQESSEEFSMQNKTRFSQRQIQLLAIKPLTHGGGLSVSSSMCAAKWSQLGERNI